MHVCKHTHTHTNTHTHAHPHHQVLPCTMMELAGMAVLGLVTHYALPASIKPMNAPSSLQDVFYFGWV